jgi:enoyl-CoA hydratase
MPYDNVLYDKAGSIATITLNNPAKLNILGGGMLGDYTAALAEANRDREVKVVVLRGAGRAFCAGFDFSQTGRPGQAGSTNSEWDPGMQVAMGGTPMTALSAAWRSPKPVIAQVHGYCMGGGCDLALSCDIVVAAHDARIGIPYARVWGANLNGMMIYRLGLTKAKSWMLTGEPLDGKTAVEAGLINESVPGPELEGAVRRWAEKLALIPLTQQAAMKLIINQAYDNMGLQTTQLLGPILDNLMRHTPEGLAFVRQAYEGGVKSAVAGRDGPFGDYSQAPEEQKPHWQPQE